MLLSKLSRIGKKEQPSDWPKHVESFEQIVEEVRRLAADVNKGLNQHVLLGKRGKKNAEQQLAVAFKDSVEKTSSEDKLFVHVVRESADVLNNLALLRRDFELKVEKTVVDPLNRLVDSTCAGISKERRTFNKAYSETRSAREQLQRATAQVNQLNGSNGSGSGGSTFNLNGSLGSLDGATGSLNGTMPSEATAAALMRLNQAQSMLDDKERELTGCREKLLRDLYSFIADEVNQADLLVEFMRAEEAYLEESLRLVRKAIPDLSALIERHKPQTVFYRHLSDHLAETDRSISYVLETCICRLDNETTLQEEGLFRKSGSQKKTDLLVKALNLMQVDDMLMDSCDSTCVTGALKQYLNSLPEPLITFPLAESWALATKTQGSATLDVIQSILQTMPQDFRLNLAYLCLFLHKVSLYSAVNKMTPDNLSIVIAPNLYRLPHNATATDNVMPPPSEFAKSLDLLQHSGPGIRLVDLLINHAETLFAEDKASFVGLLQRNHGSPSQSHSRTPSNASLVDSRRPKLTGVAGAGTSSTEELSLPVPESEVMSSISKTGNSLDVNNGDTRPTQSSPHLQKRRPVQPVGRKKTIAPKPPIPSALPSSIVVSVIPPSSQAEPPSLPPPYPGSLQDTVIVGSSTTPTSTANDVGTQAASDPVQPPTSCSGMHFTRRDESPGQQRITPPATNELGPSKAPPKRPPRPTTVATPK